MTINVSILTAFITGVLGPVLVMLIKYYLDKRKKPDIVKEALEVSQKVNTKLDYIREVFHADRVWVAQFHNGGNFYPTGKSMAKFSIIYEVVEPGVSSMQNEFQSIPVNLFSKSINYLLDNDVIEIPDFKDETIATHGLKYIAEESSSKSGYLFAIKSIEGKFVGVLSVGYTKRKTKLDSDDVHELSMHAMAIGGVLSEHTHR